MTTPSTTSTLDVISTMLTQKQFSWISGKTHAPFQSGKYAALFYLPENDDYAIGLVAEDKCRLISLLSPTDPQYAGWFGRITSLTKTQAKRSLLGENIITDAHLLHQRAQLGNGKNVEISFYVRLNKSSLKKLTLGRIDVYSENLDLVNNCLRLTPLQLAQAPAILARIIARLGLSPQPFGELYLDSRSGEHLRVEQELPGYAPLQPEERLCVWRKGEEKHVRLSAAA